MQPGSHLMLSQSIPWTDPKGAESQWQTGESVANKAQPLTKKSQASISSFNSTKNTRLHTFHLIQIKESISSNFSFKRYVTSKICLDVTLDCQIKERGDFIFFWMLFTPLSPQSYFAPHNTPEAETHPAFFLIWNFKIAIFVKLCWFCRSEEKRQEGPNPFTTCLVMEAAICHD